MPEAPAHGIVVLAAGASQRLGQSKQLLCIDGETLVHRAVRLALATAPAAAVLVVGAVGDAVAAAVADLPIRRVDCADWARGMGASLRVGLAALPESCAGALVVLCDQPALGGAHLAALVAAWRANPRGAAASAYAGRLGVPALLPRAWFAELQREPGDHGARDLLARRHDETTAVANAALAHDIDTPGDLGATTGGS
jgi:CTP:molybdopterin cytidylyltransferase MocA